MKHERNTRLNEYFAVVGIPDGPLLVADPPPPSVTEGEFSDEYDDDDDEDDEDDEDDDDSGWEAKNDETKVEVRD